MAGIDYSLIDAKRPKSTSENVADVLRAITAEKQRRDQQQQANAVLEATMRQKGYVPQAQEPASGIGRIFSNIMGGQQPTYVYDPESDPTRKSTALDQYYKMAQIQKTQQDIAKGEAETKAMTDGKVYFDPKDKAKATTDLRKEFRALPRVKEYSTLETQVGRMNTMLNAAKKGDLQGRNAVDQALIMMYNKLSDPTSVVRESEYARTPEGLSLINMFQGKIDRVVKGGAGLTDQEREELVKAANLMFNQSADLVKGDIDYYSSIAKKYGLPEELITGGISTEPYGASQENTIQEGQTATNPQTGQTIIFRGGQWQNL